jgi:hypothetical protein
MLTRDAVVVVREAMEKAVVRIRGEKLLEEQKKKEEQEKRQKEERERAEAEAAAKVSKAAKAAVIEKANGNKDEASVDTVDGDVDAFDDLMIGKTYTDDENTATAETSNTGGDDGPINPANDNDNEDDEVEMEQSKGGDEDDCCTKRKRAPGENTESVEVQPAKKQAKSVESVSTLDSATQSQDQSAPRLDSDSSPTDAAGGRGERMPHGGDGSDQDPFQESLRSAFHFLDRGSGKATASLRGYITFEELQTLL